MARILVVADLNLNLLDGSTIWVKNICNTILSVERACVTLLARDAVTDDSITSQLNAEIKVIGPGVVQDDSSLDAPRVTDSTVVSAVDLLEGKAGTFDYILSRGSAFTEALIGAARHRHKIVAYLTGPFSLGRVDDDPLRAGLKLYHIPVIVQSERAKQYLEVYDGLKAQNIFVIPPLCDDYAINTATAKPVSKTKSTFTISYAGKLDAGYDLALLCDLVEISSTEIRIDILCGKQTNVRSTPELFARFDKLRASAPSWATFADNLPQVEALKRMRSADFAFCLRSKAFDHSFEISSKLIEYCRLGVFPIVDDISFNREIFGPNYPFLIPKEEKNASLILGRLISLTAADLELARKSITEVTKKYSTEQSVCVLRDVFKAREPIAEMVLKRPLSVLYSGHDFKFLRPIATELRRRCHIDDKFEQWRSTKAPGPERVSGHFDLIFCEWCCANAVWYSKNKPAGSRLFVRLHRFEAFTDFPMQVDWDNVDCLIVVSEHFRNTAVQAWGVRADRILVHPQPVHVAQFDRRKHPGAADVIGMVGINPWGHKRFDRAIQFFSRLISHEPSFKLRVRSSMPWELRWVWENRPDEREQYSKLFENIQKDAMLRDRVAFDSPGSDMEEWYREIGYILSSSDTEGCHTAVIEGMASGCEPIIFDWPGARTLFPHRYVYNDLAEAVPSLVSRQSNASQKTALEVKCYVAKYSVDSFINLLLKTIDIHEEKSDGR